MRELKLKRTKGENHWVANFMVFPFIIFKRFRVKLGKQDKKELTVADRNNFFYDEIKK